jgi:hypothetical protein
MINYPGDRAIQAEAKEHGLGNVIVVRDLARIVEVLNLDEQDFFSADSVVAGSMALRCFNSPRFTIFDADFSTSQANIRPLEETREKFSYLDDDITIDASGLEPSDQRETLFKSDPIKFSPRFTQLASGDNDRRFKADVSTRGLELPGIKKPLVVPYDLGLWAAPPEIWVMDPHEILAEKILGWCADRLVKHYADAAFISLIATGANGIPLLLPDWSWGQVRDILEPKLETMRKLQPGRYAELRSVDALVGRLAALPEFEARQWADILYLRAERDRFSQAFVISAVQKILVPNLRSAGRR